MLEGRDLHFSFRLRTPLIENASITLAPGEILGLSGVSGSGKSTVGRLLAGHLRPQRGAVRIDGAPPARTGFHPVQYLAQTPILAMNPRWRIGRILREAHPPTDAIRSELGVDPAWDRRYPHQLSGGELQRVSLLRTLGPALRYLIADETTSGLDAVAQAELWSVLMRIARTRSIGILAISHDDALLARIADRRMEVIDGVLR